MALTLEIFTNTWIDLADAESYFEGRLSADNWNDAADSKKEKALVTAYRQLNNLEDFSFPTSGDIDDNLKYGQCEQALFLLNFEDNIDIRTGLQAQGVEKAGTVKETYKGEMIGDMPLSPAVKEMISGYSDKDEAYIVSLTRDDDEDTDDD